MGDESKINKPEQKAGSIRDKDAGMKANESHSEDTNQSIEKESVGDAKESDESRRKSQMMEKRPSLDDSLKLSSVKKVNKIELHSLKVAEGGEPSETENSKSAKDEVNSKDAPADILVKAELAAKGEEGKKDIVDGSSAKESKSLKESKKPNDKDITNDAAKTAKTAEKVKDSENKETTKSEKELIPDKSDKAKGGETLKKDSSKNADVSENGKLVRNDSNDKQDDKGSKKSSAKKPSIKKKLSLKHGESEVAEKVPDARKDSLQENLAKDRKSSTDETKLKSGSKPCEDLQAAEFVKKVSDSGTGEDNKIDGISIVTSSSLSSNDDKESKKLVKQGSPIKDTEKSIPISPTKSHTDVADSVQQISKDSSKPISSAYADEPRGYSAKSYITAETEQPSYTKTPRRITYEAEDVQPTCHKKHDDSDRYNRLSYRSRSIDHICTSGGDSDVHARGLVTVGGGPSPFMLMVSS